MTRDVFVFGASILWCMALSGALLFLILMENANGPGSCR